MIVLKKKTLYSILSSIKTIVKDLNEQLKNASCYKNESITCYETFGIDLMLTSDYKVKLLEVNSKIGLKEFKDDIIKFNDLLIRDEIAITVDTLYPPKIKEEGIVNNFIKI